MSEPRKRPRLRTYLLGWFAGCAVVMVVAYTQLLEYYLELGIILRTESFLERTALAYEDNRNSELPSAPNLASYLAVEDIPTQIRARFSSKELRHAEMVRRYNVDFDDDDDDVPVDTGPLCSEGTCDLLFLYPYQLQDGQWLYLLHGVVGSDTIYDELELTEQVAFAIGTVFMALFLLVSFLGIRSIDAPLRRLERWSENLASDQPENPVPDLRFRELDALAERLQFAFGRIREGVDKEKLFLRHASHELRTPLAILSNNVELIDRLTDRPERSEAEHAAIVRQYRALDDVQLLIETLLWVNRQSEHSPKPETLDLREEVDTLVENYRYLLEARSVALTVNGRGQNIDAPAAAVRIVLSNLLRNAFQYTIDGEVLIEIQPGRVSIRNANIADVSESGPGSETDTGFGLGLELVELICKRFQWTSTTRELPRGRETTVQF